MINNLSEEQPLRLNPHLGNREPVDVLVIDDELNVRTVLAECLTQLGYTHRCAQDGKVAVMLLEQCSFKLVVTDIFMPRMDGIELIMHCRRVEPMAQILTCSGGGCYCQENSALESAHLLGSGRTLVKPFSLAQFVAVVREMIGPGASG